MPIAAGFDGCKVGGDQKDSWYGGGGDFPNGDFIFISFLYYCDWED